jgi:hypothetical protein
MRRVKHNKGLLAMLATWLLLAAALLVMPGAAESAAPPDQGKLIVHEWGTFLSVQAPDGEALGGMIESEEDLPPFVRERALGGLNRLALTSKMETPVTYFYVDRPRSVEVRVDMPKGLLTHWFPRVRSFGPPPIARPTATPAGSFLDWGRLELIPAPPPQGRRSDLASNLVSRMRAVSPELPWRFVRETDSALVKFRGNNDTRARADMDVEKFLFYRGLGALDLPLMVRSNESIRCGTLSLSLFNRGRETLPGAFVISVDKQNIRFSTVPALAPTCLRSGGVQASFGAPLKLAQGVPEAKRQVADALVKGGLYRKEAEAMVNNWEKSYFRTEGTRVLYLIPRPVVDQAIPLRITPAPSELVRVMVGRVEVLTARTQRNVEAALVNLGSTDPRVCSAALAEIARLGRLKEPVLRRIIATTRNATVKARAEQFLKGLTVAADAASANIPFLGC